MRVPSKKERLDFFKDLYTEARAALEDSFDALDRHYRQYKGDNAIDPSPDMAERGESPQNASIVRNITYELIESQITTYIPSPKCDPISHSERAVRNAMSVEQLLRSVRNAVPFEALNDLDERYTYIYGGSIYLVEWDESIKTHDTVGGIKASVLSPRRFVGQPYIYNIEDMEYCFIEFETTKEDLVRKYGVSFDKAEETSNDTNGDDDTATMYICYYKDEEDRICQYIWSGDVELRDLENYYSRKREYCLRCRKKKALCNCEEPEYETRDEEFEELEGEIVLSDGENVIPAEMPVFDENGMPVMDDIESAVLGADGREIHAFDEASGLTIPVLEPRQVPRMQPTKLPFYTPKRFPVVIRKNTSKEDSVLGQSDCEFIRPQQQAINKIESRIMQKLLRAGVTPVIPDDASVTLNNSIFGQVIRVKPGEKGQYGVVDTQVDISRDLAAADRLYDQAKRILGISESFQGHYDASAKSGVAKQTQAMQSSGRLDSKRKMKNFAWSQMDAIIFELYLAFADEPRPIAYKDAYGNVQEVKFSRYDFLCLDENFEWYYDDEYLFSADASADFTTDRNALWQENRINFERGTYGDPADPHSQLNYWLNQQKAHYPFAQDNVKRIKEAIDRQAMMQQLQEQLAIKDQQIAALTQENANRAAYGDGLYERAKAQEKEITDLESFISDEINKINSERGNK